MRRTCRGLPAVLLSAALLLALPGSHAAAAGTMRALGTLGGKVSFGYAINRRGQVAGASAVRSGAHHAFIWGARAGMIDLGTLGGSYSEAYDLNNRGVVVGFSAVNPSDVHAFRWTTRRGMVDLGTLGGRNSTAHAVNARGEVVGSAQLRSGATRAFLWTERDGMVSLGTLGGDFSIAYDLNDQGQVVGASNLRPGGEPHPFLWAPGGGMVDLGTLGGQADFDQREPHAAKGINAQGDVVGYSLTPGREIHAFRWTAAGGMADLGSARQGASSAEAINGRGQVAGGHRAASSDRATLWTPGGFVDLGSLDGVSGSGGFSAAHDVSPRGHVVGITAVPGGGLQAFLWVP